MAPARCGISWARGYAFDALHGGATDRSPRFQGRFTHATYHGDKVMASLWLIDPAALPKLPARTRKLKQGPLIDLTALQSAITQHVLDDENVWLATTKATNNLQDLNWCMHDLLVFIGCLSSGDFKGSEWCEDSQGNLHACDAYAMGYDDTAKRRVNNSVSFYLKFSLTNDHVLKLALISCHLSS